VSYFLLQLQEGFFVCEVKQRVLVALVRLCYRFVSEVLLRVQHFSHKHIYVFTLVRVERTLGVMPSQFVLS